MPVMESPRKKPVIQPPQKALLVKLSKSTMTDLTKIAAPGDAQPTGSGSGLQDSCLWKVGSCLGRVVVGRPVGFIVGTLPYLATILAIYLLLITLCYNEILDPCTLKYSYARYCQKVVFISEDLFSYTEYKENYICLMPGVYYQSESKGWYSDTKC